MIAGCLNRPWCDRRTWRRTDSPTRRIWRRPYGLVRNHGFVDGNKRTAWVVARLLLADNGVLLRFGAAEVVKTVELIAAGPLAEATLADWFRARIG